MAKVMRAKMQVQSVKEVRPWQEDGQLTEELELSAVCGTFGEMGESEDNTYSRYTPTARLSMTVNNPALFGKIKPGQKFYLDFTEAED